MPEKGGFRQPEPAVSDRSASAPVAGVANPPAGGRIEKAVQPAGAPIGQHWGVTAKVANLSRGDGNGSNRGLAVVRLLARGIVDGRHGPQLDRGGGNVAHAAFERHAAIRLAVTSVIHNLHGAATHGAEEA